MTIIRTLSDGTTVTVRSASTMAGVLIREVPSRKRPATAILWRYGSLHHVDRTGTLTRIENPMYSYAETPKAASVLALSFFVDSAESCITHAREHGIAVGDCYAAA